MNYKNENVPVEHKCIKGKRDKGYASELILQEHINWAN